MKASELSAPAVRVRAPEGTKIFVDGNEVQAGEALDLEAGEHLFKFNLGGYEVTKKVAIQNGKSYNVSVNVDASTSINVFIFLFLGCVVSLITEIRYRSSIINPMLGSIVRSGRFARSMPS